MITNIRIGIYKNNLQYCVFIYGINDNLRILVLEILGQKLIMHIPDGFLDTKTIVATSILSATGIAIALKRVKANITPREVPLMGLAAAFVFVSQMLNFPVVGGTSGHLIGTVLVAVLLGPSAAILVMSSVLVVQCLLFADGGILSLGANILNMAIVGSVVGYSIYRLIFKFIPNNTGRFFAIGIASWLSVIVAAMVCVGELGWSNTVAWQVAFPVMINIHMLIGIGEALITILIVTAVQTTRPELLQRISYDHRKADLKVFTAYTILILVALLVFVSPFVSPWPDGLERVASMFGFEQRSISSMMNAPLSGYQFPGVGSGALATAIAGFIGAIVVFVLSFVLAKKISHRSSEHHI